MDKSPSNIIREDPLVLAAGEKNIELFKYFAAVAWGPVVIVVALFRGETSDVSIFVRLAMTGCLLSLIVSGTIFYLAYAKQNIALVHLMMGEKAIDKAATVNPSAREKIDINIVVSHKLGNIADRVAFPLLSLGYAILSLISVISLWV